MLTSSMGLSGKLAGTVTRTSTPHVRQHSQMSLDSSVALSSRRLAFRSSRQSQHRNATRPCDTSVHRSRRFNLRSSLRVQGTSSPCLDFNALSLTTHPTHMSSPITASTPSEGQKYTSMQRRSVSLLSCRIIHRLTICIPTTAQRDDHARRQGSANRL